MQKILNRARGQARLSVESAFPERFLNICAAQKVPFWDVARPSVERVELSVHASDCKKALDLAEKSGCRAGVISQKGAPFFLMRFRRRHTLIAGMLLCAVLLAGVSQFVWEITVEGSSVYSDEEILGVLAEIGVREGMRSGGLDIAMTRCQVLLRLPGLSWITVNIRGSRAEVIVRDRTEKPDIIPRDTPCNITAGKAGLIESILTLAGSAHVAPGQTVIEGELLVSGIVDSAQLGARLIHARAEVTARTWYELAAAVPTETFAKVPTGRVKTRNALIIAGNRINLYSDYSQPFEFCDKIVKTSVLRLPPNVTFPVTLVTEVFTEYRRESLTLDAGEAGDIALSALEETLARLMSGGEKLGQNVEFETRDGALVARLFAECREKIDVTSEIPIEGFFPDEY